MPPNTLANLQSRNDASVQLPIAARRFQHLSVLTYQITPSEAEQRASAEGEVPESPPHGLTESEEHMRQEHMPLRAAVLYEITRSEGEGELARGFGALWWSGLAAVLSIGFSPVAQAALKA